MDREQTPERKAYKREHYQRNRARYVKLTADRVQRCREDVEYREAVNAERRAQYATRTGRVRARAGESFTTQETADPVTRAAMREASRKWHERY